MPPALLSRDEVLARVLTVVRRQGYDGASLAELSKATGLGKSSLYHHFPDGKDDMIGAVLSHLEDVLERDVFAPLRAPGDPEARLRRMCQSLDDIYSGGREACLLATLGVGESSRQFHSRVRRIFRAWIGAIAAALRDAGVPPATAESRAEEAVARIEGSLVVARSLDAPEKFARMLKKLPAFLLDR